MRTALAPRGRQAAPVTDRCRHHGSLPCRYVECKQTLPARRAVGAPFHPNGNVQQTKTDELILQDKSPDYRVLNFATDAFNENNTSYWHKNIGGYHAAKLRRYQELIERHVSAEMQAAYQAIAAAGGEMDSVDASKFRVLNMLNTKYFILPSGQQGQTVPVLNPYANGNAWFVKNVQYVNNANEEIDALKTILPTETAVVDARFKNMLKGISEAHKDSLSSIHLTTNPTVAFLRNGKRRRRHRRILRDILPERLASNH